MHGGNSDLPPPSSGCEQQTGLNRGGEIAMTKKHKCSVAAALLGGTVLAAWSTMAAEVTPQRLINPEPQNWLMNHRTYDAQRYSPLDKINKDNVKGLKLAYAVALGGTAGNESLQSTPLAEDGYLYVVEQCDVVYKIDGRTGEMSRNIRIMAVKK